MTIPSTVALAFAVSFVIAVVPFGVRPTQIAFWGLLLYGWPLLVLAWTVYIPAFKRTPARAPLRAVIGAALFACPSALLQLQHWALNGELVVNPVRFYNALYFVFLVWYLLFGIGLGALSTASQATRSALK